jgi:phosphohistidine phosphatase
MVSKTMLIYLLRHGDASSDCRFHDSERPLTERGEHQAAVAGKYLHKINTPIDYILFSPLKRAQQTAEIVNSFISSKKYLSHEYLVNGTDQRQLLKNLNDIKAASVLLVGHMPQLSDTVSLLIHGNYENDFEFKKCSLMFIEIATPILPGSGKLLQITHNDAMVKFIQP